jgi:hypothetical protein
MTRPTVCNMSDLSELRLSAHSTALIHSFFPTSENPKVRLYQHTFARLIDKAIFEYQMARDHLLSQVEEAQRPVEELKKSRMFYMDGFTNHLENCINAIGRLFRLLEKLLSEQVDPPIPRTLRRMLQANSSSLVSVRNTMEHIDDVIQRGELEEGTAGMILLGKDQESAIIGGYSISFYELETTLRKLHEVAHHQLKPLQKV